MNEKRSVKSTSVGIDQASSQIKQIEDKAVSVIEIM